MRRPVIVVPGYYGSKLSDRHTHDLVWLDGHGLLNPRETMEAVNLDSGDPDRLYASGILDEVAILPPFIDPNVYKRLRRFLRNNLHYPADHVHEFFYDWRKSILEAATTLNDQVERWRTENGADKVDLVCHSTGGLVARAYMKTFGSNAVNWFVTLGTPHKGMLKTFEALYRGIKVFTFSRSMIKATSRTFPSAFELLPQSATDNMFIWDGSSADPMTDNAWISTASGSAAGHAAMQARLAEARAVHTNHLSDPLPVKSALIFGTRSETGTLGSGDSADGLKFPKNDDGDGTVPRISARGHGMTGASELHKYGVPFANHMLIFDDSIVEDLLTDLLVRDVAPPLQFVARFRAEPIFVPRTKNRLVVELSDSEGTLLQGGEVRLTIQGTTIRDREVPQQDRGDFVLDVRMPESGAGHPFTVTARADSLSTPLTHRGLLVSARA